MNTGVPFPELPTDNLYKFVAMTGLVLIVGSLVFPWYYGNELTHKELEYIREHYHGKAQYDKWAGEHQWIIQDRQYLDMLKDRYVSMKQVPIEQQTAEHRKLADELRQLVTATEEKYLQRAKQNVDQGIVAETQKGIVAARDKEIQVMKESKESLELNARWFFWIGVVLAGTGFILWWLKVQQYQDAIVALEAENLRRQATA